MKDKELAYKELEDELRREAEEQRAYEWHCCNDFDWEEDSLYEMRREMLKAASKCGICFISRGDLPSLSKNSAYGESSREKEDGIDGNRFFRGARISSWDKDQNTNKGSFKMDTKKIKDEHVLRSFQKGEIDPSPEVLYNILYTLLEGYIKDLEDILFILEQAAVDMDSYTIFDGVARSNCVIEMINMIKAKLYERQKDLEELKKSKEKPL